MFCWGLGASCDPRDVGQEATLVLFRCTWHDSM